MIPAILHHMIRSKPGKSYGHPILRAPSPKGIKRLARGCFYRCIPSWELIYPSWEKENHLQTCLGKRMLVPRRVPLT